MNKIKNQAGFLTILSVVLIVIIGFTAVALTYITFGSSFAAINLQKATSALFLAESGLEDATHELLTSTISNRNTCAGLSLTNASIGDGAYSVTASGPFYVNSPTTLTSALNATATTIPVASTTGYQSAGRIMIDRELINYTSVDTTHFNGVTRGADGSTAAIHALSARVGQSQCNLASQGGAPTTTLAVNVSGGKRQLTESIQLQEGWVAGNTLAGPTNWNIAHWNTPTEKQWVQQAPVISSPQTLNSVSIVSNVDAWIVGSNASALHYNGAGWSNINTGITGTNNLLSVSGVSSIEAWTCSAQGKIYKWSGGASWTNPSSPGGSLNSISMLDTNGNGAADTGWAVGTTRAAFLYNGTTWATKNGGITQNLNAVSTLSATDAWAAGVAGTIFHWTGATNWSVVSTPSSTPTLNGISMINTGASDIGWAVGTSSTAWFYNGTTWTSSNTGITAGLTLNDVVTVSTNEAWLVDSSGHVYEWNGSTWTLIFTSTKALNGIDIAHPNSEPFSAWAENFS